MKKIPLLMASLLLTACVQHYAPTGAVVAADQNSRAGVTDAFAMQSQHVANEPLPLLTINEYSRVLVHELMSNHHSAQEGGMVGVTDFAYVDTALDQGTVLSNHLSEAIMYDLHKFGVAVLDYKVTDYIRVTPSGDFALSRDFTELSSSQPIRFVVTGTLTAHKQGVLVNARLIRIDSKQVVAAARTFVPHQVVAAVLGNAGHDKLQLKQG